MTHELKKIIAGYRIFKESGIKCVLASVVALEGSSYRRPGVRMLIAEDGTMIGAVSGGCVEKEIQRRATEVFQSDQALMMTYDGRYRLGCEGILYILIELFDPSDAFLNTFDQTVKNRQTFHVKSYYSPEETVKIPQGTTFRFSGDEEIPVNQKLTRSTLQAHMPDLMTFSGEFAPCFKLVLIGAEHDTVQLCTMASILGWEVTVVAPISDPRTLKNFPGAETLLNTTPEAFDPSVVDERTAVVLMTHSFVNDLKYFIALKETSPAYLGLLGPSKRRDKLINEFLEFHPDASEEFLERVYGPAGLHLGAETPQEIALSILSQILSVTRGADGGSLREKSGRIHDTHESHG